MQDRSVWTLRVLGVLHGGRGLWHVATTMGSSGVSSPFIRPGRVRSPREAFGAFGDPRTVDQEFLRFVLETMAQRGAAPPPE